MVRMDKTITIVICFILMMEEEVRRVQGLGDLVSRFIKGVIGVILWLLGVITLLTKSP